MAGAVWGDDAVRTPVRLAGELGFLAWDAPMVAIGWWLIRSGREATPAATADAPRDRATARS